MPDQTQVCQDILANIELGPFRVQGLQQLKEDAIAQFDQQIAALQQLKENTIAQFDQRIAALQQDLIQLQQVAEVLQCPSPPPPPFALTPHSGGGVRPECEMLANQINDGQTKLGKLVASDPGVQGLRAQIGEWQQRARALNCP